MSESKQNIEHDLNGDRCQLHSSPADPSSSHPSSSNASASASDSTSSSSSASSSGANAAGVPAPPKTLTQDFAEMDRRAMEQYQATHEAEVSPFPPPTGPHGRFGLELTFTNQTMVEACRDEREADYGACYERSLQAWLDVIRRDAPEAVITPDGKDAWDYTQVKVYLPQLDLTLFLHADDWVIEVGSSPLTSKDLARHEQVLQTALFDAAADLGIKPHPRVGGGHLHLEYASHFGGDAVLLRNFIVDLCNRPLLFLGALNTDLLNAPPLAILPESQQQAFIDVLKEFDALPAEQQNTAALKDAINAKVYCKSYIQRNVDELSSYNKKQHKYHAINLLHKHTVEVRGFRPQPSARVLLREMQLLEGRINALRGQPLLVYNPQNLSHLVSWSVDRHMESYEVKINKETVQQSLRDYVRDAGMSDADFPYDQIFL